MDKIITESAHGAEFPWRKNLYIVWLTQFVAMIGMTACVPFLPLYVRQLGVTQEYDVKFWSGLVYAAPFFISVFAIPVWGALSDGKYSKKFMVVRAVFGLSLAMFLMGFAQNVWHLFLLRLFQGAISGFIAACLALVSCSTPEKDSGYAIAILQTASSCGSMIGPLIGGIFADTVGLRQVFFLVAAFCAASGIIAILLIREKRLNKPINPKKHGLRDNIRLVMRNPLTRRLCFFIMISQTALQLPGPILAFYIESLAAPAEYLGTITGSMSGLVGLLIALSSPVWGKYNDANGHDRTLSIALPFLGIILIAHGLATVYFALYPLRIAIGIFTGAMLPTLYAALSKNSPQEHRGGMMGLASSANVMGNCFGPLLGAWTAAHWGMRWTFASAGSILLLLFAVQMAAGKKQKHEDVN